jgi:preprotein translocase subunit SecF
MNILGKRYYFFLFSLLLIVPGLIVLAINGMPLSIDFIGGTALEVQFATGNVPDTAQVKAIYDNLGITDAQIQTTSDNTLFIRSSALSSEINNEVMAKLREASGSDVTILRSDTVGPTISQQVATRALLAIGIAALAVIIYIAFAFRGLPHALRYGVCAIIAMLHDILVVISVTAIGGQLFGWQVDSLFLTALLTVIGFSVQDKIVVFDRIRENSSILRKLPFEQLANHSIIQTLQRSINTQLMTVEYMLLAIALFGGVTLREFAVILLVGLLMGTYSSIFVAAPLLVVWENKEWRTWFGRKASA